MSPVYQRILVAQLLLLVLFCSFSQALLKRPSLTRLRKYRDPAVRVASRRSASALAQAVDRSSSTPYSVKYFTQRLDHFNFQTRPLTYKQRYLISDQFWNGTLANGCRGPIFFYTGNESPVTLYWEASGLFTDVLAPKFGALLVFAEHRYEGESLPFGEDSFTNENLAYCSAEQAMADYVDLIQHLKSSLSAENCPVIAFGGSYGGMLTYYFKMKYPNIVWGGLAASAPIGDFYGSGNTPYAYSNVCNSDYIEADPTCFAELTRLFPLIEDLKTSSNGLKLLSSAFRTCQPLSSEQDVDDLVDVLDGILSTLPMLDYPYPTNYGLQLPAWPVNTTCSILTSFHNLSSNATFLEAVSAAMAEVVWNITGNATCFNVTSNDVNAFNIWDYLACTEFIPPSAENGLFPHTTWNLTEYVAYCNDTFGVMSDISWEQNTYAGWNISDVGIQRIIFSNGLLDPWHSGGILHNVSDSAVAIVIEKSAHHFDLRGPNQADPPSVTEAREREERIIAGWIQDYVDSHM